MIGERAKQARHNQGVNIQAGTIRIIYVAIEICIPFAILWTEFTGSTL